MTRENQKFEVVSDFKPAGDQPSAIAKLSAGVAKGLKHQVLLGVTGSGKTFSMAHVIAETGLPTLVLAPNKTLAAQLYNELRELLPKNAVEYFVSYYDFYQPEAYIPQSNTYIEKDAQVNDEIDKLRHSATRSLLARKDVVVVASVSCIYGLGSPKDYLAQMLFLQVGQKIEREAILRRLVDIQYERKEYDFYRGSFRVRGGVIEVFPSHEEMNAFRIELEGEGIAGLYLVDAIRGRTLFKLNEAAIYPASHYVTDDSNLKRSLSCIRDELRGRLQQFQSENKFVEAQRLEQRTLFDLEMMEEMGFCKGIENYSRHLTARKAGEPPPTLVDFFPRPFLVMIDESHVTLPQLKGMYRGDRSRKETLVEYGFRLPSALDNRPLRYEEFADLVAQTIYVSATPTETELELSHGNVAEQVIRPTGLLDPVIVVKEAKTQVDDLLAEAKQRIAVNERVLATTLTKRMAEDLTDYLSEMGIRVRYLHSDVETIERVEIIRGLRKGDFDVLVGINLLREGLDLPEVSLVAVLDADKEGFLRSQRSLIQTMGRAARNINGKVILYADIMTDSMKGAINETERRRQKQVEYNRENGITPESVKRKLNDVLQTVFERDYAQLPMVAEEKPAYGSLIPKGKVTPERLSQEIRKLEKKMQQAAQDLRFEEAIQMREQVRQMKALLLELSESAL